MPDPALQIRGLTAWHGDHVAVDSLSLEISPGEVLALLGPNGSGKSTTLAAIAGQAASWRGSILVSGVSQDDDTDAYRRSLGFVPQDLAIYEELTAFNNLLFFGRMQGIHGRDLRLRAADALDFVQLSHQADRCPATFSGGMKRRLNLACALLHEPSLLLLDEPTVGLDIASRDAILEVLGRLRRKGVAIVLATHHLHEARALADRVAILQGGRLVLEGRLDEISATFKARSGYFTDEQDPLPLEAILRSVSEAAGTGQTPLQGASRVGAA